MEHFKQERIEYLDYYNNRTIKAKLKGLPPAMHRQQALSAAWTIFTSKYCLTLGGHFTPAGCFFSLYACSSITPEMSTGLPSRQRRSSP